MMTTKDIILRAEQYANKENASFYSYAEKIAMLNESWYSLYQYLCNTGDNYWIKEIQFNKKECLLPKDCYQVSGVYRLVNKERKQIFNYRIKNNKIEIKESNISGYNYVIEYYPQPITLTYKEDEKKCPFQIVNMVDINDGKVLSKGETYYSIYDTAVKTTIETQCPVGKYAHIYDDGNIVVYNTDKTYNVFNISTKTLKSIGKVLIIYNNSVYFISGNNIIDFQGNIALKEIETIEDGAYITEDFITFNKQEGTIPINNSTSIIPETNTGVTDNCKIYNKYSIQGYCDNSLLTYDGSSLLFYTESLYNNTIINYPNNIFYTILAIDVALKMRAKQGIDNTLLQQQYLIARTSLFNSIEKNKGNNCTIKDVYEDATQLGSIYY